MVFLVASRLMLLVVLNFLYLGRLALSRLAPNETLGSWLFGTPRALARSRLTELDVSLLVTGFVNPLRSRA